MKQLWGRLGFAALVSIMLIGTAGQKVMAQDVSVSYQTFYDDLSPYGQWVSDPQYGNVWVPNEGGDFRPYGTNGHWAMTDYGNTWVSDDPWGWAPYHYGRWTYDPYYGWVWIPGYEWAPAWVSWRYGGGNCGWAPLGPGISVGATYNCPDSWWVFVGPQYMYQPNCIHYWRGPSYNTTYIRQTTYVNNVYVDNGTHTRYNYGPRADAITQVTHQPVQVYHFAAGQRAGAPAISGNRISMYRPAVNRTTMTTARPTNVIQAPRQIGKPQAATNMKANTQAPFRQQMQSGAIRGNTGNQPGNRQPAPVQNQPGRQPVNNQAQPTRQPGNNQAQPNRQQAAPQPTRQQPTQQAPQPQRQQSMPQQQTRQQQAPQPQRQQPMPQQQTRQQQAPQPQRQPQMQQPQRQQQQAQPQRMEQPRQQPQQQQRMEQPRPQQMQQAPRQAPQQREEQREGGGRR